MSDAHKPEWIHSEEPAIKQFLELGYQYQTQQQINQDRESRYDVLIPKRLRYALKKLNPWLDEEGIEEAIRQLRKFETNIALEANETTYAKLMGISRGHLQPITVTQDLGDGPKPHTVKIFDFNEATENDFLITNQFKLVGHKEDILPDIVVFVNGIPVSIIECKSPTISNPISEAIYKNFASYQRQNTGFEQLFYYNQFLVAVCGTQAKYAPTYAEPHNYKDWVEAYPYTEEQVKQRFGRARKQEILIAGMFDKSNLIDLIRNFIVFEDGETKRIKKIAKYQQFRAIQKTINKINSGSTPTEKGGIIWHTQGSGKSLTMVWLALQLKRKYGNPTVLVVTDRRQLDRQIHSTFQNCGFPNPIKADDRADLKSLIENNRGQTIMTTIQKFPFFENEAPHSVSDDQIYVLVDEGHRTQYGVTAADMRAALPNAVFFAYTGTPLIKKSKSVRTFGEYIDKYRLEESEADGATLPIYYDSRLTELSVDNGEPVDKVFDRIFKDKDEKTRAEIKRKYANPTAIAESPDRIKKIANNILEHYEEVIRPNGLKAMIVAPSRKAAVLYKKALDDLNAPESRIIMSPDPRDKEYGWDIYHLTEKDKERYEERFKLPLDKEGLSILIVVDMLLTGFDAPILQALYLDQGLKEHTLLQAIARVNRPYGEKKKHGLIVDYWGLSKNLQDALALYDDADVETVVKKMDDAQAQLDLRHKQVMSHFTGFNRQDTDAIIEMLEPDDIRTKFEFDFKQFAKYMDMLLPDPFAAKYRTDLSFLAKIRAMARTAYYDEDLDLKGYGEKVKKLIEESIRASKTLQLIEPTKIDSKHFLELIESYGSNKTRASAIERKARKVIDENEQKNPEYYKSLRQRLEEIIQELRNKKFEDAAKFKELQTLLTDIFSVDEKSKSLGFETTLQFAIFNTLEKILGFEKSKELTLQINAELAKLKVIEWRQKEPILKEMRVKIKDILSRYDLEFDAIQEIATQIVNITKEHQD